MIEHEEEYNGIKITLELFPEYDDPYFVAKVTVSIADIELGEEYLYGCVYDGVEDFINDGYYTDMKQVAIEQAKENIINIMEKLKNETKTHQ